MKLFYIISIFIFLLIGCTEKKVYSKDSSSHVFKLLNKEDNCRIVVDLYDNKQAIKSIYSTCMGSQTPLATAKEITKLINHFSLNEYLKQSHIIKMTFIENKITFPNLLKFINKSEEWSNDIFTYEKNLSLKENSNLYYRKLSHFIVKSNLYTNLLKELGSNGCKLEIYPNFYDRDKELYTKAKEYDIEFLMLQNIVNKNTDIRFPSVDYLPIIVKCN